MRKPIHLFFFLLLALASCKSCDREEVVPVEKPRLAYFTIFELMGNGFKSATDTVLNLYQPSRFVAYYKDAFKYEWKFSGDDRLRTDTAFNFSNWNMDQDDPPNTIKVTLKVWKKKPNSEEMEVDSFSRNWTTVQIKDSKILGRYLVEKSMEGHPYEFEIGLKYYTWDTTRLEGWYIDNFTEGCQGKKHSSWPDNVMRLGYKSVNFINGFTGYGCKEHWGFFIFNKGILTGNYSIYNPEFPLDASKRFKGNLIAKKL